MSNAANTARTAARYTVRIGWASGSESFLCDDVTGEVKTYTKGGAKSAADFVMANCKAVQETRIERA